MSDTPSKASAHKSGWTDAEKLLLLVNLVEGHGGLNWKSTALPQGRNVPSCQGVWHRLKTEAQKGGGEDKSDGSPKPTLKSAVKRKKEAENDAEGVNGMAVKKKGRKEKAADAADGENVIVKAELDS